MEKRLTKLHVILAIILLFTPLVLILTTGEVRSSISNYAYSSMNHLFATRLNYMAGQFNVTHEQLDNLFILSDTL